MEKLIQDEECLSMEELIGDLIRRGYQIRFYSNGRMDHVEITKEGYQPLALRVRSLVPDYRDESRYWLLRKLWLYVVSKEGEGHNAHTSSNGAGLRVVHNNGHEHENRDLENQGGDLGFV